MCFRKSQKCEGYYYNYLFNRRIEYDTLIKKNIKNILNCLIIVIYLNYI